MKAAMRLIYVILVATVVSSCATYGIGHFTQTGKGFPPYKGTVRVVSTFPPGGTYEEVGIVSGKGGLAPSTADLIAAMQEKAAQNGANAIVITGGGASDSATAVYAPQVGLVASKHQVQEIIGVAIRTMEQ